MSALPAPIRRPAAAPAPARPALRPVEVGPTRQQRKARPKSIYAVVTVIALAVILASQLLLSIALSDGAYRIAALQTQQRELVRVEQSLAEQLGVLDSTQLLAQNAAALGMVPAAAPYFLDLQTGTVTQAPGSADPAGCGGTCGLVPNTLLTGVGLVDPAAASTAAVQPAAQQAPSSPDMLLAPVTE